MKAIQPSNILAAQIHRRLLTELGETVPSWVEALANSKPGSVAASPEGRHTQATHDPADDRAADGGEKDATRPTTAGGEFGASKNVRTVDSPDTSGAQTPSRPTDAVSPAPQAERTKSPAGMRALHSKRPYRGSAGLPRMVVNRSSRHVFVQIVDDTQGVTVAQASTLEPELRTFTASKVAKAKRVGELIAERAKMRGVEAAVFDRGGMKYHGRLAAVAEGARGQGLDLRLPSERLVRSVRRGKVRQPSVVTTLREVARHRQPPGS